MRWHMCTRAPTIRRRRSTCWRGRSSVGRIRTLSPPTCGGTLRCDTSWPTKPAGCSMCTTESSPMPPHRSEWVTSRRCSGVSSSPASTSATAGRSSPIVGPASTSATPARSSTCTRRWPSPGSPGMPPWRIGSSVSLGRVVETTRPTPRCSVTSDGRSSTPSCRSAVVTTRRAAATIHELSGETHRIGGSIAQRDVIAAHPSSSRRTTMSWSLTPDNWSSGREARALATEVIGPGAAEVDQLEDVSLGQRRGRCSEAGFTGMTRADRASVVRAARSSMPCSSSRRWPRCAASPAASSVECQHGGDLRRPAVRHRCAAARSRPSSCSAGDKPAICITEPGAGSAASEMTTRAERRGDSYVLNGTKHWITGGWCVEAAPDLRPGVRRGRQRRGHRWLPGDPRRDTRSAIRAPRARRWVCEASPRWRSSSTTW